MLNFAIVGFGGLGKVHFNHVNEVKEAVGDITLTAICDVDESKFTQNTKTNLDDNIKGLDLSSYHLYTDVEEMFEKEKLDFIITALPTYLHESIAVMAMEKGIHVFSEKPMAINYSEAENMISVAKKNNVRLMIGQCLRFWPHYTALKEMIDSEKYGKVVRAEFLRRSGVPKWSWNDWMRDQEKSGGVAVDMHVHDVDFINWAFGVPEAITSEATATAGYYDSIATLYHYSDKTVLATSDWVNAEEFPFIAEFFVAFENATVTYSNGELWIYHENGINEKAELKNESAYANEVIEFVNCIRTGKNSPVNPPESSLESLRIAIEEVKSAQQKTKIVL